MKVTIGTFNLNNLFSRYNFKGEIDDIRENGTNVGGEVKYEFGTKDTFKIRKYKGKLVNKKDPNNTEKIADRIKAINVDVLAVQEAEDIDTLREFNREYLNGMYGHVVLIEGNDPRLIDLGVLSKYPIGAITSWQMAVHPAEQGRLIFGRDLLEVEIFDSNRSKKLFTIFNNHLKSHFADFRQDRAVAEQEGNMRRFRQAEVIRNIVRARVKPNDNFVILGDMNDPPDSAALQPFTSDSKLRLSNGLLNPVETRPPKEDAPPPSSAAWTHRFKESGQPAKYELYDHIWLSQSLVDNQFGSWIDRRKLHGGDGSDHDPAWVEVQV